MVRHWSHPVSQPQPVDTTARWPEVREPGGHLLDCTMGRDADGEVRIVAAKVRLAGGGHGTVQAATEDGSLWMASRGEGWLGMEYASIYDAVEAVTGGRGGVRRYEIDDRVTVTVYRGRRPGTVKATRLKGTRVKVQYQMPTRTRFAWFDVDKVQPGWQ